jgi:2,4-dihydroxyhept-2-ene-1,7-dioic acid aldolase
MVNVLLDLRENHNVIGVKAEFEAEGTRLEEALRLKEVVSKAGLDLTIKIGGCEAVRDIYEARVIGVAALVAPMIESPYALTKYISAVHKAVSADEELAFHINIETIDGFRNLDAMLALSEISSLTGIVVGRGDMACSLGLTRDDINTQTLFEITQQICIKAKEKSLKCTIGGGVSADTLPFLQQMPRGLIDRYETRKVIFKNSEQIGERERQGILKGVGFEMMWLKNKRDYYGMIYEEDQSRLETLSSRYESSILAAGGKFE